MGTFTSPPRGAWYHLHLRVSNFPRPGSRYARVGYAGQEQEVEVVMGHTAIFYETPQVAMYQDQQSAFTVIHPRKTIIWTQVTEADANSKARWVQQLAVNQQQWLKEATFRPCRDTLYEGQPTQVITIVPAPRAGMPQSVRRITYYFAPATRRLFRQVLEYNQPYPIARQVITYLEMDFSHGGKHAETAYERIFVGKSGGRNGPKNTPRLQPQYRTYEVKMQ